ncbi:hypothetical protein H6G41_32490 [Tolypothrix sp. FACHB-123]|uniref:hypothetical protein n=1 Tax=Tolypothrix sp. FACHB-123 TaxID=2692868 RepID=UPI0016833994|nr:hypothetical protein [Tolypothrix sp. FACHB-123]MBD2359251.1 hypothetical protein [Tolypothrix sp. FACHB-123]
MTTLFTFVRTIFTSDFGTPSPDPSGIVYINHLGSLFAVDGEVDEMPTYFTGRNIFQTSLSGTFQGGLSTMDYSNEPTGIAYNPANRFLYIADDNKRLVFTVDPGEDGKYNTNDDVVSSFSTAYWGSFDPEDIVYSRESGTLFVVDGLGDTVYHVTTNGTLLGQFNTLSAGLQDPEGIAINPLNGNLFMVGFPSNQLFEFSTSGQLLNTYNISAANALKPAGIAFAPSSDNPSLLSIYIVDRAVDNDTDPAENDGKIYEFALNTLIPNEAPVRTAIPNQAPAVAAGQNQIVLYQANLNGSVFDEEIPLSGSLTTTWSVINGPGNVDFADAADPDTTVTFSTPGTYILQLTANDGQLSGISQTTIQVLDPTSTTFVSFGSRGTIGGISHNRQDILAYDQSADKWHMYFDGSDVFGAANQSITMRDFHINADGSILFSINNPAILPGEIEVDDADVVKFIPTTTGDFTSGRFELYFDGSDVGLPVESGSHELDAIALDRDGNLVVSLRGSATLSGITGSVGDEDLIRFRASSLGEETTGTWEMLFDGSDVGLNDGGDDEDVNGVWFDPYSDKIFLTTNGAYSVAGASGDGGDIFVFNPTSLGVNTSGSFSSHWDGSTYGIASTVILEGISVAPPPVI